MLCRDEELRSQVLLRHGLVVQDRQRSDPRQDQVLGHFIRQSLEGDQENLGRPQPAKKKYRVSDSQLTTREVGRTFPAPSHPKGGSGGRIKRSRLHPCQPRYRNLPSHIDLTRADGLSIFLLAGHDGQRRRARGVITAQTASCSATVMILAQTRRSGEINATVQVSTISI